MSNEITNLNLKIFADLIEADPESLYNRSNLQTTTMWPMLSLYRQVLIAYFRRDITDLKNLYNQFKFLSKTSAQFEELKILSRLRLDIARSNISVAYIKTISEKQFSLPWSGEIRFVLGYAFGEINKFHESKNMYELSIVDLKQIGANKKAAKALHNIVATNSSINTDERLIDDYFWLAKEAKSINAKPIAGIALINIAREYQILKLFNLAKRYVIRGRALLRYEKETVQYYLSLLYHIHILIDLNQIDEAKYLFILCEQSIHPEVKACLRVLKALRDNIPSYKVRFKKGEKLLPGWGQRLCERDSIVEIGELEEKLIHYISYQPRNRLALAKFLYGERLDSVIVLDRLKSLLSRIKKKWLNLILVLPNGDITITKQGFSFYKEAK